jgi:hypothetical protein
MSTMSIKMGFVVHLELKSVKRSMVTESKTIPVEITKPKFSSSG